MGGVPQRSNATEVKTGGVVGVVDGKVLLESEGGTDGTRAHSTRHCQLYQLHTTELAPAQTFPQSRVES